MTAANRPTITGGRKWAVATVTVNWERICSLDGIEGGVSTDGVGGEIDMMQESPGAHGQQHQGQRLRNRSQLTDEAAHARIVR